MSQRVAETSKTAYQKIIRDGKDVSDRERCLAIIEKYGPITMEEMEIHMGKRKNAFSGRIRELKDQGKVEVVGVKDSHQELDIQEEEEVIWP